MATECETAVRRSHVPGLCEAPRSPPRGQQLPLSPALIALHVCFDLSFSMSPRGQRSTHKHVAAGGGNLRGHRSQRENRSFHNYAGDTLSLLQ